MDDILLSILRVAYQVMTIYYYLMFASIILSWTPYKTSNIGVFIDRLVDPYLGLFRNKFIIGMMDLGTLIGIILFQLLLTFIGQVI
ncbi:MAG: YggT family protein [Candidatus Izemoplasmatales bacterium]|jgi:uncharacterized protein YggT (Ycf19 family)|nr:YggT family protein [bacterium]MDZ4196887.1 YggT family protein [Candidatus Izemoplasmatales bacterium]